MAISTVPLMTLAEARTYLESLKNIPPERIDAALSHPQGIRLTDNDGRPVVLLRHGDLGYERIDETPEDQMRSMHAEGITVMRALRDEPGEPTGRRIGSTMPIAPPCKACSELGIDPLDHAEVHRSATVFFSAPALAPQTTQEILVGQTLTLPISARDFTGDQTTLKIDPFPLPPGASFTDHGDGSGTFTFTPQVVGAWDFIFTASDGIQQLSQSVIVVAKRVPPTQTVPKPDPTE